MSEIHVFSGLGSSLFSRFRKGTDEIEALIDALPSEADAQSHIWNKWRDVRKRIVARHQVNLLKGPIILIGHSNGVFAAMSIAEELAKHGIEVDYIAAIDPTLKRFPASGPNIKDIDEFHATTGFVALFRKLTRGRKGTVKGGSHTPIRVRGSHVGIVSSPTVKNTILKKVEGLLK